MTGRLARAGAVGLLMVALPLVDSSAAHAAIPITVTRIAGATRDLTAVAASQELFPTAASAKAVVLASDATFADALAGAPLAVAKHGPLLITTPSGLDPAVGTEISRVLPAGATVYILGGTGALSPTIDTSLTGMGFAPQRLDGVDRFGTAVAIAGALGNPTVVLEASGLNFPDGLSAGAAASAANAAVLLTNGSTQATATAAYLAAHTGGTHYAIGGPASAADPAATAIVGADRYTTATSVATQFFPSASLALVGVASGLVFPDALSGGANIGSHGGPLLLVPSSGILPSSLISYLAAHSSVTGALLYGGTAAVNNSIQAELDGVTPPGVMAAFNIAPTGIVGMSCPAVNWCMAVDGAGHAINYSNGAWAAPVVVDNGARSMSPTGEFDGVSCPTTTFCMAVSYNDGYSIYSGTWAAMAGPGGSIADSHHGVSCATSLSSAAESDNFGDLTFWNSGVWSQPKAHNGIGIGNADSTPISCAAAVPPRPPTDTFCMYVTGDKYQTSTGGVLSAASTIDPSATADSAPNVSCTSATAVAAACVVVFGAGGVADVWNGTSFTSAGHILAATDSSVGLYGVSCTGTFCAAVSAQQLYTSTNGGTSWTDVGAFTNNGTGAAISCPASTACFVGGVRGYAYTVNPSAPISPP